MDLPFVVDLKLLKSVADSTVDDESDIIGNDLQYGNHTIRTAFETVLVKQTLDFIYKQVPYYRKVMTEVELNPFDFNDLSDLRRLPLLTRADFVKNRNGLVAKDCNIISIRSTSGTTAQSVPIFFSDQDLECDDLWRRIMSRGVNFDAGPDIILDLKPSVQRLVGKSNWKGLSLSAIYNIDGPPHFRMDVSYEDFIIQQLFEYFPIPGKTGFVTILRCTPPFLLLKLTKAMLERGISPSQSHVKNILFAGGHPTKGLLRFIAEHWNSDVQSSFSCSELNGFARNCSVHKNRYHFDATIFVEVLDLETNLPVNEGEDGMLVLTSLYPFQQAQPFIRYILGDIVRYHGHQCICGNTGSSIEFRGRLGQCVDISHLYKDDMRRYLGTVEIEDALSLIPEVPAEFYPRFRISANDVGITLDVEVVWRINSRWERELSGRIEKTLRKELGILQTEIPFPLTVNLYNKGQIKDYCRLYPAR